MAHISKSNFKFLKDLSENNNREWFDQNKNRYANAHDEVISMADALILGVNKFDSLETANGKKALFRIYRDVRFSQDKSPYKTHWGIHLKRLGEQRRGGYYFHIEEDNVFIGGGFWSPSPQDLQHIRQQIDIDPSPLRKVLKSKNFKDYFGQLQGEKLKNAPKGFEKDNPNIDLINHKQFIVSKKFTTEEALSPDFDKEVIKGFQKLIPFFDVMSQYLTTNLNGESII